MTVTVNRTVHSFINNSFHTLSPPLITILFVSYMPPPPPASPLLLPPPASPPPPPPHPASPLSLLLSNRHTGRQGHDTGQVSLRRTEDEGGVSCGIVQTAGSTHS